MHIYPEAEVRAAWGKVLATRERAARHRRHPTKQRARHER